VGWLTSTLPSGRKLVRTYYYNAAVRADADPDRAKQQQRFFDRLQKIPYFDVRLGRLEPRGNTFVEKGVDVGLAVDMLSMAVRDLYDTAVLVSCDGDYVTAIRAVQDMGKHVEVACFQKAYHLKAAADKVIPLSTSTLKGLWMSSRKRE